MILFGHHFIESPSLYHIENIDAIKNTPPSSLLYIEFNEKNLEIIKHTQLNNLPTAIKVHNIKELIFATQFQASYAICEKKDAKKFQNIAEEYLFDTKIIAIIKEEEEIEELALKGIDGVLFQLAIIKTNS